MRIPSLHFLLLIGFAIAAQAELDQPQAATDALFGKPLSSHLVAADNLTVSNYRNQNYDITAGFKNNVTAYLVYRKKTGGNWTDDEIRGLLATHVLGHDNWHWNKDIITGRRGPAVHRGAPKNINAPEVWHIFAHKEYVAAYYPEKATLIIWDSGQAETAEGILARSAF